MKNETNGKLQPIFEAVKEQTRQWRQ